MPILRRLADLLKPGGSLLIVDRGPQFWQRPPTRGIRAASDRLLVIKTLIRQALDQQYLARRTAASVKWR